MYHPSYEFPTEHRALSRAGEYIFTGMSLWMLLSTPEKLEELKTNILNLANNHVCRNITNRFNLFNSALDGKKSIPNVCYLS